ncbi:conserved hypothetical protein (plasmid) [Rhodococcus jostii RHA1]|uniref:Uncharacterized protein n=1 Tax=Rhodococcus jostii (strain RHA1) TaxID=101510 RepID=Q0RXN6_RHOJR|nr:conserved hypothetical protein [Rhodococcus jostii RHA1]
MGERRGRPGSRAPIPVQRSIVERASPERVGDVLLYMTRAMTTDKTTPTASPTPSPSHRGDRQRRPQMCEHEAHHHQLLPGRASPTKSLVNPEET